MCGSRFSGMTTLVQPTFTFPVAVDVLEPQAARKSAIAPALISAAPPIPALCRNWRRDHRLSKMADACLVAMTAPPYRARPGHSADPILVNEQALVHNPVRRRTGPGWAPAARRRRRSGRRP